MTRRPPRSTRTDTLFPYTTLFRSLFCRGRGVAACRFGRGRFARGPAGDPEAAKCGDDRDSCRTAKKALIVHHRSSPEIMGAGRSEEHTSELQSLMRISYAVFCLKKKNKPTQNDTEEY